jgi:type III restriction enzyme
MVQKTLRNIFRTGPEVTNQVFEVFTYNPSRITNRKKEPNRFGTFSKDSAYGPWQRSSHEWNWFDSAPELNMANLLDSDIQNDGVKVWSRILRNEGFSIQWSGGTYTPDFYAEINDEFYLIEVKADRDMETTDVEKKKEAAANLARALTDDSRYGKWHYSLISESDLKAFRNVGDLLK